MDFSFIIVNHNSEKFLRDCIDSIQKNISGFSYEILIVHNDGRPHQEITDEKIKHIHLGENCGFGHACNVGANKAVGEIFFFLNPDTKILTVDMAAVRRKLSGGEIAIAAPILLTASGKIQPWSFGKKITPWKIIGNNLGLTTDHCPEKPRNEIYVDWVSGAAFFITKKIFLEIGGFDEKFFMYWEDVDLCLRIRNSGKKMILLPQFEVMHIGGQSFIENKKQKSYYYASQNHYLQKHFTAKYAFLILSIRKLLGKV
jgi:GT2 family glycosyltransferase